MLTIALTEQQRNNLLVFLNRVDIKGAEVPAFTEIMLAIHQGTMQKDEPVLA